MFITHFVVMLDGMEMGWRYALIIMPRTDAVCCILKRGHNSCFEYFYKKIDIYTFQFFYKFQSHRLRINILVNNFLNISFQIKIIECPIYLENQRPIEYSPYQIVYQY